jgi:hypothetical protein
MPKVQMRVALFGEDKTDWLPGEIHEASDHYARYLINREAATLVEGEVVAAPALTTQSFTDRDPKISHRDPVRKNA